MPTGWTTTADTTTVTWGSSITIPTWTTTGSGTWTWSPSDNWVDITTMFDTSTTYMSAWPVSWPDSPPRRRSEPRAPDPTIEQRRQQQATARSRAEQTLLSLLSAEERQRYEGGGGFMVRGSAGGEYHVRPHSYAQNVERTWTDNRGNRRRQRLCAHPHMRVDGGDLPTEDALIAQLLMLRFDEPGFLAIANVEELRT